jgi:hypothetical protein
MAFRLRSVADGVHRFHPSPLPAKQERHLSGKSTPCEIAGRFLVRVNSCNSRKNICV